MKKVKFLIGLVVCMATIVYPAFAYDYDLYDNFVGDSLAVAEEDVGVSSSTSWYATIHSWITPELYIDAIGWSRWTFQEICGGTVVDNWPQSGYTVFGGSLQDWGYDTKDDCSYTHQGRVFGRHYFREGERLWEPDLDTTEGI